MINIDQLFTTTILNGGLAVDIIHENGLYSSWNGSAYVNNIGAYVPQADRPFIEIKVFPADERALTLANTNESLGYFQAILKYPADTGTFPIKSKAEALLSLFIIGDKLTYSGQSVYNISKRRDGGRIEGGFYQIVCRINYQAFITR